MRMVLGFLGVLALFWLVAFSAPISSDLVTGVVILEVFTLVPAAYLAYQSHISARRSLAALTVPLKRSRRPPLRSLESRASGSGTSVGRLSR